MSEERLPRGWTPVKGNMIAEVRHEGTTLDVQMCKGVIIPADPYAHMTPREREAEEQLKDAETRQRDQEEREKDAEFDKTASISFQVYGVRDEHYRALLEAEDPWALLRAKHKGPHQSF